MPGKSLQLVVKITKLCNMRCAYCYEFDHLGDPRRMTVEQIRAMFQNVADWPGAADLDDIEFIWHGGEPLVIKIDQYEAIRDAQREVFGDDPRISNALQTNLTVLTDAHIEFFKTGGFFHHLGVSFDPYGSQRVDKRGALRNAQILTNMERLAVAGVPFGAISVLCQDTLPHVRETYRFFDEVGLQFRLLPIDCAANDRQADRHGVSSTEIGAAYAELFEEFLSSDDPTTVKPLDDHLALAAAHRAGLQAKRYDKTNDEAVFVVDLDGGVYGEAEAYDPAYCYGNIFEERFDRLLESPARAAAMARADRRLARYCDGCRYRRSCPGFFVGDASDVQERIIAAEGCPMARTLDLLCATLEHLDLDAPAAPAPSQSKTTRAAAAPA